MMEDIQTRIVDQIKDIYIGPESAPANVAKEHTNLYLKARKKFGTWRNALEASGIDYHKAMNNNKWSRELIISEIIRLHNCDYDLRPSVLRNNGGIKLLSAANYHFGSWKKAMNASGIDYMYNRNRK